MRLTILLLVLLFAACAPKLPQGTNGELRKQLYYDANLAFSVAIPEGWQRQFVIPPNISDADYAVVWKAPGPQPTQQIILTVVRIANRTERATANSLAEFSSEHPGFNIITQSAKPVNPAIEQEVLGHTPSRTYRVVHLIGGNHLFRFELSTPPELFEQYQPLFDLILASFEPLA